MLGACALYVDNENGVSFCLVFPKNIKMEVLQVDSWYTHPVVHVDRNATFSANTQGYNIALWKYLGIAASLMYTANYLTLFCLQ